MFTVKTSLSQLENVKKNVLWDLFLLTIDQGSLICYRPLTGPESKLWSYNMANEVFKCVNEIYPACVSGNGHKQRMSICVYAEGQPYTCGTESELESVRP